MKLVLMPPLESDVKEFLNTLTPKNYCLITHRNADLDAIASALVLREIIIRLIPSVEAYVIAPDGLDSTSKYFLSGLSITPNYLYEDDEFNKHCDCYLVIDAASKEQLGRFNTLKDYILVDHHEVNTLTDSAIMKLYEPKRKSTSEIVAYVLFASGVNLMHDYLTLLIGGILHDSRFLYLADGVTFSILSDLIRLGGDYVRARNLLIKRTPMEYSERIARLKAMSRLGIYKSGKYVIAITCIGAYEGNVLKSLLDCGADISIAIAPRDEGFRVTVRVNEEVVSELGKPLAGLLTSYLAELLGGSGGGHSLAAGSHILCKEPEDILKALESFFKLLVGSFKTVDGGRWLEECS